MRIWQDNQAGILPWWESAVIKEIGIVCEENSI